MTHRDCFSLSEPANPYFYVNRPNTGVTACSGLLEFRRTLRERQLGRPRSLEESCGDRGAQWGSMWLRGLATPMAGGC